MGGLAFQLIEVKEPKKKPPFKKAERSVGCNPETVNKKELLWGMLKKLRLTFFGFEVKFSTRKTKLTSTRAQRERKDLITPAIVVLELSPFWFSRDKVHSGFEFPPVPVGLF